MKIANNISETEYLLGVTDFPCLSVILPGPFEHNDQSRMSRVVNDVDHLLQKMKLSQSCQATIHERLAEAMQSIPEDALAAGVYVSPHSESCIVFPFPVEEKITIDQAFEKNELLKVMQYGSERKF